MTPLTILNVLGIVGLPVRHHDLGLANARCRPKADDHSHALGNRPNQERQRRESWIFHSSEFLVKRNSTEELPQPAPNAVFIIHANFINLQLVWIKKTCANLNRRRS
jgi:hypothetical protein